MVSGLEEVSPTRGLTVQTACLKSCEQESQKGERHVKDGLTRTATNAFACPFLEGGVLESIPYLSLPQLTDPLKHLCPWGSRPGLCSELTACLGPTCAGPLMANSAWGPLEMLIWQLFVLQAQEREQQTQLQSRPIGITHLGLQITWLLM